MTTTTFDASTTKPSRGLHISLWIVQGLLALAFGMAGTMKLLTPISELAEAMPWVADAPALVRFIGASELAGALGLILPAALRIMPRLTAWAGVGLFVVMVLGAGFHASRGEFASLPVNVLLGALAGFVAWGRFKAAPIE